MSKPNNIYAKEYDDYLIKGDPSILQSLPLGSIERQYANLTTILKEMEGYNEEFDKKLQIFLREAPSNNQGLALQLISLSKEYESIKDDENKKQKFLNKLKDIMGLQNPNPHSLTRPTPNQMQSKARNIQTIKYESVLDNEKEIETIDSICDKIYNNKEIPNDAYITKTFKQYRDVILDLTKINNSLIQKAILENTYNKFLEIIGKNLLYMPIESFKSLFEHLFTQLKENQPKKKLKEQINNWRKLMSNEQIDFVVDLFIKNNLGCDYLISELIKRKYNLTSLTKQEKKKTLLEINALLKKMNFTIQPIKRDCLLSILEVNTELNEYDKEIFKEYLECPSRKQLAMYVFHLTEEVKRKISENNSPYDCPFINYSKNEEDIIKKHLLHFFYKDTPLEEFQKYFQQHYIYTLYNIALIYQGKDPLNNFVNEQEKFMNEIYKETKLNICAFSKLQFALDEDIQLTLEIKNIETLFIKVYEINTENYYYTNKKQFDNNLKLEGLVPTHEEEISYKHYKPQLVSYETITLSKIPKNKRGTYIIEFVGNGYVARAVITKGALTLIYKNTSNGIILYILDENKEICKGENTGLWLNNTYYKSDINSGAIAIPFQSKAQSNYIIFKHDGFACCTNIYLPSENYSLETIWYIKEESLIMENKCTVILRPYLYVNNEPIDISLLKNAHININIEKAEHDKIIPISTTLNDIILSNRNEYVFEVKMPSKIRSMTLALNGEIEYKSIPKSNQVLTSSYNVKIADMPKNMFFMKVINGDHVIEVLGKNGECIPHMQVKVNLYSNYLSNNLFPTKILESDDNGKINLGKLNEIYKIVLDNNFEIPIHQFPMNYYDNITTLKGNEIKIPLINTDTNKIYLIKYSEKREFPIENHTDKITYDFTSDTFKSHGYAIIKGLDVGNYSLKLGNYISIKIDVIEGKKWEYGNFITTKDYIVEGYTPKTPCILESFEYNEKCVKLKITPPTRNAPRVHLIGYHYYDRENGIQRISTRYRSTNDYRHNNLPPSKYYTTYINNCIMNDKLLDEEIQYILNRKYYTNTMGNSLDKPSLLVKPQFVRDTNTQIQEAAKGHDFTTKKEVNMTRGLDKCCRNACDTLLTATGINPLRNNPVSFNFIAKAPVTITNLVPNEKGMISTRFDLTGYSHVQVIIMDDKTCYEEIISLNNDSEKECIETQKIDLRMGSVFKKEKNYCELRKVRTLSQGDNYLIKDLKSVSYQLFDSIEKYISYLLLVCENDIKDNYNKFKFILNFDNLKLNEKLSYLSLYFSHEFNLFLYFQYNDFFNEYVLPLIKFKIEKTFIDYFLMNDTEMILKYTSIDKIATLNIIEKCLLIYSIKNTHPELAKGIATQMQIKAEQNKPSQDEIKLYFTTALNIQKTEIERNIIEESTKMETRKLRGMPQLNAMQCAYLDNGPVECERMACVKNFKMAKCARPMKEECFIDFKPEDIHNIKKANEVQKAIMSVQEPKKVKEYKETQYYIPSLSHTHETEKMFYIDLVLHWINNTSCIRNQNFLSKNILIKPTSFREFMFVISVLDLPIQSSITNTNFIKNENLGMTIEAKSNSFILTKELSVVKEKPSSYQNKIIIAQQSINQDNIKDNLKYLTNTPYHIETIITNISNKQIGCELLMQIPEGAIPLDNNDYTKIENVYFNRFQSRRFQQHFYFPSTGTFTQYPPSASINENVVAKATPKTYEVLTHFVISKEEIKTIDDVLERGNKDEILEFISKEESISHKDISKTFWILSNKDFYTKLIAILKQKLVFIPEVWKHSLLHSDFESMKEYIEYHIMKDTFTMNKYQNLGYLFNSAFLKIDKTNNTYMNNHKDYFPVVPGRIHLLHEEQSNILTVEFRNTYQNYISYLMMMKDISDLQWMRLCYYLILQQRMKEAKEVFDKIKEENVKGKYGYEITLQYDYVKAYLDFSFGYPEFKYAREIAEKYKDIPLTTWNEMFAEMKDQLNEYDGKENYDDMK